MDSGSDQSSLDAARLGDKLAQLANQAGIRQWDIGVGCSTDSSVQVDRGEAKQLKGAQRSSSTVRVWNDANLIGITSTTDLSEAGLARALEGAKAASAFGNPQETPNFSPLATAPLPILEQPLCPSLGILNLLSTLKQAERLPNSAAWIFAPSRTGKPSRRLPMYFRSRSAGTTVVGASTTRSAGRHWTLRILTNSSRLAPAFSRVDPSSCTRD
jgi:hypothetical protein